MPEPRPLPIVDPLAPRGALYRGFARLSNTAPMLWLSRVLAWKLDPLLLRLTGGRVRFSLILPTALLTTKGARSGAVRQNAVIYFHDGDRVTIVASKAGAPEHPAWFHNLVAHPEVTFGGHPFRAVVVTDPAERSRLWRLADAVFPPFADYRERVDREIPLVQLERRT
jgi:deazaflavin-dependent oxidoreductase (nitroreductase family)